MTSDRLSRLKKNSLAKQLQLLPVNTKASICMAVLLAINVYLVQGLFVADFTTNMQTNAGSFMAISRFIVQHFPHLDWFPWWFNGEPFENSYTPMLHLIDAAFAWITGSSTARAFNFVTASFYALGPCFLFLFAWRITNSLKSSFLAGLLYSLFSPVVMFARYRLDLGEWDCWRLRCLTVYGEGPHNTVLCFLPVTLLMLYRALTTRRYVWCVGAGVAMALLVLTNAFAAIDLAIGAVCLIVTLPSKEMFKGALLTAAIAAAAYAWISPFLTPTLIQTIYKDSQVLGGDYSFARIVIFQIGIAEGFIALWFLTRRMRDSFLRFCLLFSFVLYAIVALDALASIPALPQPHRYSLEMEMALSLLVAFAVVPLLERLPRSAKVPVVVLLLSAGIYQFREYSLYARQVTQKLDVTETTDYQVAEWFGQNLHGLRAFVSGETGTWLNVFVDTPQMSAGHLPFNPNRVVDAAVYVIYSDDNAGDRAAKVSILWLKAYGCHAIHVSQSRLVPQLFAHPHKFDGILPVLWHQGEATIYAVPQRTQSLAHVVPADAPVHRMPINGLDTDEIARYVAALDDSTLPDAPMRWQSPGEARIDTVVHPGQVISVQTTYDAGWLAIANARLAPVTRDGIGMSVIHADCDGPCSVSFIFDGGTERRVCRFTSWTITISAILAGVIVYRRRRVRASELTQT